RRTRQDHVVDRADLDAELPEEERAGGGPATADHVQAGGPGEPRSLLAGAPEAGGLLDAHEVRVARPDHAADGRAVVTEGTDVVTEHPQRRHAIKHATPQGRGEPRGKPCTSQG